MTLPSEITITPNEANGAPYLGYEGGEGVVYVPKDQWSTDMDASPRYGMFLVKNHDGIIHQCKFSRFGFYSVSSKSYLSPACWRHIDKPHE